MKVSVNKPYWHEPIEDVVEKVVVTAVRGWGGALRVEITGGERLGDGELIDDQLTVTVTSP